MSKHYFARRTLSKGRNHTIRWMERIRSSTPIGASISLPHPGPHAHSRPVPKAQQPNLCGWQQLDAMTYLADIMPACIAGDVNPLDLTPAAYAARSQQVAA